MSVADRLQGVLDYLRAGRQEELQLATLSFLIPHVAALEKGWQPIGTAPTDGTTVLTCIGVHDWDIAIASFKPWHPSFPERACWRNNLTGEKIQPRYWIPLPPRPTFDPEKR